MYLLLRPFAGTDQGQLLKLRPTVPPAAGGSTALLVFLCIIGCIPIDGRLILSCGRSHVASLIS